MYYTDIGYYAHSDKNVALASKSWHYKKREKVDLGRWKDWCGSSQNGTLFL